MKSLEVFLEDGLSLNLYHTKDVRVTDIYVDVNVDLRKRLLGIILEVEKVQDVDDVLITTKKINPILRNRDIFANV